MKKLILLSMVIMCIFISASAFGATLNLKATWDANSESDMKEYRLYDITSTRVLVGTIAHPNTSFNFTRVVPDQSSGMLSFVLVAVDTNNNASPDSTVATYSYNTDTQPPTDPKISPSGASEKGGVCED